MVFKYQELEKKFYKLKNESVIYHQDFVNNIINYINSVESFNFDITKINLNEFELFIYGVFDYNSKHRLKKEYKFETYMNDNIDLSTRLLINIYYNSLLIHNREESIYTLQKFETDLKYITNIDSNDIKNKLLFTLFLHNLKTFNMSYFGNSLRNINEFLHELRCKYLYKNNFKESKIKNLNYITNNSNTRIKIGILAYHIVSDTPTGKHIMQPWYSPIIDVLDERYEKILIIPYKHINLKNITGFKSKIDKIIYLDVKKYNMLENYDDTINKLKSEMFDILYYPSIGMYNIHVILSDHKLAKTQIMSAGHPITSGSKYIDYILVPNSFIQNYEIPFLQKSFTEKVINDVPINYIDKDFFKENIVNNRKELRMRNDIFYVTCFQQPHKITNYMYELLNLILSNTHDNIHIILLVNKSSIKLIEKYINKKYHKRLNLFEIQPHKIYMSILNASDIILDSYPFNGCTTTYEAFIQNKIVIGLNRQGNDYYLPEICLDGIYRELEISGLTVNTYDELVNIINVLYYNRKEKQRIENIIKNSVHKLFEHKESLNLYNDLFEKLHLINKPRIFNISCNKTGTTSLEHLFVNSFGFRLFNYMKLFYANKTLVDDVFIKQDYTELLKTIENSKTNFFSDIPFNLSNIYKILDKNYPNSKFILSIRNTESWINCLKKWLIKIKVELLNTPFYYCSKKWVQYAFPKTMNENWEIINEDLLAHLYEKHNNDIIDYFKGTDKLLVYKLEESSEFKINKICDFIQIKNDNYNFPHKNKL
jgi:predicted O-linked N-acetylglucosamine transferase (SPINDLY family)